MSARSILTIVGLTGWLAASVVAFLIVAYASFFGIAFVGLVIAYCSTQFELDGDRPVGDSRALSFLGAQVRAKEDLTDEQRMAARDEQSLSAQSARFFKHFGLGLLLIGLVGGLYQLL